MSGKGTLKFLELRPMLTFRRYSVQVQPRRDRSLHRQRRDRRLRRLEFGRRHAALTSLRMHDGAS